MKERGPLWQLINGWKDSYWSPQEHTPRYQFQEACKLSRGLMADLLYHLVDLIEGRKPLHQSKTADEMVVFTRDKVRRHFNVIGNANAGQADSQLAMAQCLILVDTLADLYDLHKPIQGVKDWYSLVNFYDLRGWQSLASAATSKFLSGMRKLEAMEKPDAATAQRILGEYWTYRAALGESRDDCKQHDRKCKELLVTKFGAKRVALWAHPLSQYRGVLSQRLYFNVEWDSHKDEIAAQKRLAAQEPEKGTDDKRFRRSSFSYGAGSSRHHHSFYDGGRHQSINGHGFYGTGDRHGDRHSINGHGFYGTGRRQSVNIGGYRDTGRGDSSSDDSDF